ncbi:MAG: hypothetical protein ACRDGN_06385 [bacterium]
MPQRLALPDGYRVSEAEGSLRLFNPQGVLLDEVPQGLTAASEIKSRAWLDAWEQIESELKDELRGLREGTRSLHELHRMRQYMRMLDAMAREPVAARERAGRRWVITGMALATAAAAVAVVILAGTPIEITPEIVRNPQEGTENIRIAPPATIPATKAPSSVAEKSQRKPLRGADLRARLGRRPADGSRSARAIVAAGGAAGLSAITGYAVGFGEFANRAPAEIHMHLVRAKGYIVYVTQVGDSFYVMTRPYRARAHAERLANALNEIGLPTTIQAATRRLI